MRMGEGVTHICSKFFIIIRSLSTGSAGELLCCILLFVLCKIYREVRIRDLRKSGKTNFLSCKTNLLTVDGMEEKVIVHA